MPSATSTRKAGPLAPPTSGRGRRRARWAAAAGLAAAVVLAVAALNLTGDDPAPVPTTHTVVYEVTGPGGRAPEIRFAVEGTNTVEKAEAVGLPWRKELTIPARPGLAVAQVMATNGQGESISCTITVDGHVVANNTAKGEYTTVSCSNMIAPAAQG
ncbi:MmpS family transport accessory protein [Lentzea rhizosphaerae]|uniref:MmpS family transport accessory protein n=1 Tax=Lentzea rhizosphaerae TaxID=2041025 RepID=A0ABV8C8Q3_9PSEU